MEKDEITEVSLEERCLTHDFSVNLRGEVYCGLAYNRRVECGYLAQERDHNGLFPCQNLWYTPDERCFKA